MLRVVVAVALAVALLGVSMPAIETARVDHADARVETELDHLESTAQRLRDRNDLAPPGLAGARRTVTLHLPARSFGSAGLDYLVIPDPRNASAGTHTDNIEWRVEGGRQSTYRPSVRLVGKAKGGLTLRQGGRQRVVLELVRVDGRRAVVVRREFKSEDGTRPGHVATFDARGAPFR